MGQLDWKDLEGSLSISSLKRGVTAGIAGPNGGNGYVYGYNSLTSDVVGAHAKAVAIAEFAPTGTSLAAPDGGGSASCAMKRVSSTVKTGMTPFLFICAQGANPSVNDRAYMLGLLDSDPYKIVLAKGVMVGGIVESSDDAATKILAVGSTQYTMADGLWHHLKLNAIVQPNGDVVLKVYESNLAIRTVDNPNWTPVPGFDSDGFIDDVLEINSGSSPLWGGHLGYGFAINNALNVRGAFDAFQAFRTV